MRALYGAALAAAAHSSLAADALTLGDALAAAYLHNPTLQAARAAARAADESFTQARAGALPHVTLSGSYGLDRADQVRPAPTITVTDLQPHDYSLTASQQIFSGGRYFGAMKRADAEIASADEDLRSTEQDVLLQAITAFVDVRRDEEIVAIRLKNIEVLQRQLDEAQARFEVGDGTRTDVAQAQSRLAGAVAEMSSARADLEGSRARYVEIVGEEPGSLDPPPAPPAMPAAIDEAIDKALAFNPAYLAAKEAERAAKAQIMVERADLWPQVAVVGTVARQYDQLAPNVTTNNATAVVQVSVPFYDGGLTRSRVRQSKENFRRAQDQSEAVKHAVTRQVTTAWSDMQAVQQVILATAAQLKASEVALEGTRSEFEVGLRTTLDVLNAEQELLDARLAAVRADRDAYVAAHALLQVMGKLDPQTLRIAAPIYDPGKHRRKTKWRF